MIVTVVLAPAVYPDNCPHLRIQTGLDECGGPCRKGTLPCQEEGGNNA